MVAFKRLPIKSQITTIVITSVLVSLFISGTAIVIQDRYVERQLMLENLLASAEITASRSAAPLIFSDPEEGLAILGSLVDITSTQQACLYNQVGTEFIKYPPSSATFCTESIPPTGWEFSDSFLQISTPSVRNGEMVGTLVLFAPMRTLTENTLQLIVRVSLIMLATGLLAFFIARYQQKFVSGPILQLTQVAKNIADKPTYSIPPAPSGAKEIETLWQTFGYLINNIKDNQAKLIEREKNLELTLESIGDAVIATDINSHITRMNPIAEQLTGWALEEVRGQPLTTIFKIVDATTRKPMEDPVTIVLKSKKIVNLSNNTTLLARHGKEYQIADSAAPIVNEENRILGVILVFHDVSEQYSLRVAAEHHKQELEKSEAQVRLLLNSTFESIFGIDTQGACIFANAACAAILGYKQSEDLLGKPIVQLLTGGGEDHYQPEANAVHLQDFERALHLDKQALFRKDGSQFMAEYRSHPLYQAGVLTGAVVTFLDISEKILQQEQLNRAQKMDALGKLTGGIAHDYNNILGIILGYAQLLMPEAKDHPKILNYATEIERAGNRGADLTRKLLTFSRHQPAEEKLTDINTVIRELRNLLEKTITVRFTIQFDLSSDLGHVQLNKGDLEDALVNLCINASHAMSAGGTIVISTSNSNIDSNEAQLLGIEKGKYVALKVADTGIGMDDSVKSKIFDPFFTTKGEAGTGLGLTQLYGFVQHLGGTVTVQSAPGEGSCFTLLFPRQAEEATVDDATTTSVEQIVDLNGNETILVVDDEEPLLRLTQELLEQHGYRVFCAKSASEALDILSQQTIKLVLSDIIMPGMDGYAFAQEVRKRYPKTIIQLISGYSEENQATIDWLPEVLRKPISSTALLRRVKNLLT